MKFIIPMNKVKYNNTTDYINICNKKLELFKSLCRQSLTKLYISKFELRIKQLKNNPNVIITNNNINIQLIINIYINSLICIYDNKMNVCYYTVRNYIKCPYTKNSINYIIRLIEFGDDKYPPIYWIRNIYNKFIYIISNGG